MVLKQNKDNKRTIETERASKTYQAVQVLLDDGQDEWEYGGLVLAEAVAQVFVPVKHVV